jgi:hypothetical protein
MWLATVQKVKVARFWNSNIREGRKIIGTTVALDANEAKRDAEEWIKANRLIAKIGTPFLMMLDPELMDRVKRPRSS